MSQKTQIPPLDLLEVDDLGHLRTTSRPSHPDEQGAF